MALEASIVERLQELRKWQIDQQERLFKQQQEQRELLAIEQERMYEALGLSAKDIIDDESFIDQMSVSKVRGHVETFRDTGENRLIRSDELQDRSSDDHEDCISIQEESNASGSPESQLNMQLTVPAVCLKTLTTDTMNGSLQSLNLDVDLECREIEETPRRFRREHFEMSMEDAELSTSKKRLSQSLLIDDMPVPSPKKDFTTLLEEKLKDSEAHDRNNTEGEPEKRIKRPFLRKGEGLARYRMNPTTKNSAGKIVKPRSRSLSTNMPISKPQKSNPKGTAIKQKENIKIKKTNAISRKVSSTPRVAQKKLNLKNVTLPTKKGRSKSMPAATCSSSSPLRILNDIDNNCVPVDESNQSDLDSSKLETKMFELLEEKAENSSFCSTSSAVVAFMQQSTPSKLKSIFKNLSSKHPVINGAVGRNNASTPKKIVLPVKLNTKSQGSPATQIQQTLAQKDIAQSKWNSGPFVKENAVQEIGASQNSYSMQQIVYRNNQTHHNGENNGTNKEYDAYNLSCSTEIDIDSNDDDHNTLDNPVNNNHKESLGQDEANVSMHVRFAEYNEYKTFGLTDTSTMSNDSQPAAVYVEEKTWSDHSVSSESSDLEILPLEPEILNRQCSSETSKSHQSSGSYNSASSNFRTINRLPIAAHCKNTECYDRNSVDQSTDDEHSLFNDSEGTYYDEDNTISELEETMRKVLHHNDPTETSASTKQMHQSLQNPLRPELQPQSQNEMHDTIFKSELLKSRLLELEREIDIFRKENAALSHQRQLLHDDQRRLQKEVKEKTENLEKDRNQMETAFQEEKKRLAREKAALENRLRDAREKSLQTKQERQEIQNLKEQLDQFKEEMSEKESRWQAAQARQRNQIRVLQMENLKLKQEIERIQATKRGNVKLKRPNTVSNTKAIHQINKQLDSKRSALQNQDSRSDEEVDTTKAVYPKNRTDGTSSLSSDTNNDPPINRDAGKIIVYEPSQKSKESISNKRYLYENLLKEASLGYHDNHSKPVGVSKSSEKTKVPSMHDNDKARNDLHMKTDFRDTEFPTEQISDPTFQHENESSNNLDSKRDITQSNDKSENIMPRSNENMDSQITQRSYQQFVHQVLNPRNEAKQQITANWIINSRNSDNVFNQYQQQTTYSSDETKSRYDQISTLQSSASLNTRMIGSNDTPRDQENRHVDQQKPNYDSGSLTPEGNRLKLVCPSDPELTPRIEHEKPLPRPPDNMTPRPDLIHVSLSDTPTQPKLPLSPVKQNIREVNHPDGHTEYWYPNGNVKRVYPDRNITKMIYYNGDVRETAADGCIKYFYAATNTWHTTYPDGFEILEFPDGQQERRTKDGVVEVSFPDGSIRLMQPDGIEKWALPDGTIAETFPNGDKILSLTNGQREIHTAAHKRREYPDGTVKFVYPDGSQETRYSNGRIRMRDKDGILVMDSHQT